MTTKKKIIPKSVNYEHMIKDTKVKGIIEKSSNEDVKSIIDSMTRRYLRDKYPTKVIEGIERIGGRVTDVWYDYS